MKKNKICVSNLLDLADEYNLTQQLIVNSKESNDDLKELTDRKDALKKEIFLSIRPREKEERRAFLSKMNYLIEETERRQNDLRVDETKTFNAKNLANAKTVLDVYFTCFAQAKIAYAMQVFSTNNSTQVEKAFSNIRKEVQASTTIENEFAQKYLKDIREQAVAKSNESENPDELKKCTQVMACEGILQKIIGEEFEKSNKQEDVDKNCEASL